MSGPSLTEFQTFVTNVMGIPSNYLPSTDPQIGYAYNWALDLVNCDLQCIQIQSGAWGPYERAVYNLAGHTLIEWATDQSYPLSALSFAGGQTGSGTVTGTTTAANAVLPGDRLQIVNVSPLGYSGPSNLGYVIVQATPSNTSFQYVLSSNPGTATLLAGAAANETYFQQARAKLRLGEFAPGVVTNSSDVSTSVGLMNQGFMQNLTLENLQLLKTAYGRAALAIMQKYGPNVWGVS